MIVSPKDIEEKNDEQRKAERKKWGGEKGDFIRSGRKEVNDKEKKNTDESYQEAVAQEKEKAHAPDERYPEAEIDVQVGNQKCDKGTKEDTAEKRVQEGPQKFHFLKIIMDFLHGQQGKAPW